MSRLRIERLNALPQTLAPSTIYIVKRSEQGLADMYFSDSNGEYVRRLISKEDITSLISTELARMPSIQLVTNITARNALTLPADAIIYVMDATEDTTVTQGGALYYYNSLTGEFIKTAQLSMDPAPVKWSDIQERPASSTAAIDMAVNSAHTHLNQSLLDALSEDTDGNLYYKGRAVTMVVVSEW